MPTTIIMEQKQNLWYIKKKNVEEEQMEQKEQKK